MNRLSENKAIDFLRAASVVGIFVTHLGQLLALEGMIRRITDACAMGVYLFFMISGYLIALSFREKGYTKKQFIMKRCIRLLPVYEAVILLFFITDKFVHFPGTDPYHLGWLRHFLLLNAVVPVEIEGLGIFYNPGATWTVPFFLLAFCVFPFLIDRVTSFSRSVLLTGGMLCLAMLQFFLFDGWMSGIKGFPFFAIGILLYYGEKEGREGQLGVVTAILFILSVVSGAFHHSVLRAYAYAVFFLLLLIVLNRLEKNYPESMRITRVRAVAWVNTHSYTIYLLHGAIFMLVLQRLELGRAMLTIMAILMTIFGTWAVDTLYTIPVTRWMTQRIRV